MESAVPFWRRPSGVTPGSSAAAAGLSEATAAPKDRDGTENLWHIQPTAEAPKGQEGAGDAFADLTELGDALTFVAVRYMPSRKHQKERWDELHLPHHAQIEGASGERVDLPAHRHTDNLVREFREAAGEEVRPEGPVAPQRRFQ